MRLGPLPGQTLGFGDLGRGHLLCNFVTPFTRRFKSRPGKVEPYMGQRIILRDALVSEVHDAEIVLRVWVALLSGPAIPYRRLGIILWHALAVVVQGVQIVLRLSLSLLNGPAIPYRGLGIILRHAVAVVVHETEIELRARVPLLSGSGFASQSVVCPVLFLISAARRQEPQSCLFVIPRAICSICTAVSSVPGRLSLTLNWVP